MKNQSGKAEEWIERWDKVHGNILFHVLPNGYHQWNEDIKTFIRQELSRQREEIIREMKKYQKIEKTVEKAYDEVANRARKLKKKNLAVIGGGK